MRRPRAVLAFERRLLQYASVVGQNFWEGALLGATARPPEVRDALASLERGERSRNPSQTK